MNLLERQNNKEALQLQVTARLLYNLANNFDLIQWTIVIVLLILKTIFLQSIILNYLLIGWFFVSLMFDYFIDKYTDTASELKKSFDYYVYGWVDKIPKKDVQMTNEYKREHLSFFKKQMQNSGEGQPRGVKNWYTTVEKDNSNEKNIEAAMRENIYFDKRINKVTLIIIFVLIACITLCLLVSQESFYFVIVNVFISFAPLTTKTYATYRNIKKVQALNFKINNLLSDDNVNFRLVQSEIDKKRAIPRTTNKLFYYLMTEKIHKNLSQD
ncbi:S-4TM family putative pore-forming effector [Leuconostoc fallax]|uniref:S-4TM family putative pore-forming effector n=1 Tax=Leuconostoc fallax TaxID=1251 RepID=UPI002090D0A8|nr:S-4TM family putative pore-forming effector [Leuconostoc fallax]MCO6183794.1 S-4TM family putative pore-forming effector [Leuconostoc fallax]